MDKLEEIEKLNEEFTYWARIRMDNLTELDCDLLFCHLFLDDFYSYERSPLGISERLFNKLITIRYKPPWYKRLLWKFKKLLRRFK